MNVNSSGTEIWFGDALQGDAATFYADQYELVDGELERVGYEMYYLSYHGNVSRNQVESEIQKALDKYNLVSFNMNWEHILDSNNTWSTFVVNGQLVPRELTTGAAGLMWRDVEFELGIF